MNAKEKAAARNALAIAQGYANAAEGDKEAKAMGYGNLERLVAAMETDSASEVTEPVAVTATPSKPVKAGKDTRLQIIYDLILAVRELSEEELKSDPRKDAKGRPIKPSKGAYSRTLNPLLCDELGYDRDNPTELYKLLNHYTETGKLNRRNVKGGYMYYLPGEGPRQSKSASPDAIKAKFEAIRAKRK